MLHYEKSTCELSDVLNHPIATIDVDAQNMGAEATFPPCQLVDLEHVQTLVIHVDTSPRVIIRCNNAMHPYPE